MLAFIANATLNAALYVIPVLLLLTVIVTVHEFGHFLTARACGVAVDRFSIGFGRAIVSFKDRWGVEWRIGWLPLGGYVRFSGDDNAASVPDQEDLASLQSRIARREGAGAELRYFYFKPLWQRALIVAAGPAINFVFSILLFATLLATVGEPDASMHVMSINPGSAAAAAGVQVGDVINAADGHRLDRFEDLQSYVQDRPGVPMDLSVTRASRAIEIPITPGVEVQKSPAGGSMKVGLLGISSQGMVRHYAPLQAIGRGAGMTWSVVARTGYYVGRMLTGKAGWPFQGLFGVVHVTGSVTKDTIAASQTDHANVAFALAIEFANLAALLSIGIGLVNLLPIPVLDGGHLLFYAYEAVARRPLPAPAQAAGYRVGLALLVGLMLFTAWNDLQRMQLFHFLNALFS
jgi:regulator of sigma E protease